MRNNKFSSISIIIPFHEDGDRLAVILEKIDAFQKTAGQAFDEVILAHNGRGSLAFGRVPDFAKVLTTAKVGIGEGYRLGIEQAKSDWVLLSASDLPFEFSDLNGAMESLEIAGIYIGSKLHRCSEIEGRGPIRFIASWGFYAVRRFLFGKNTPMDTQGTILVGTKDAKSILKKVKSRGFFFSTEFILTAQANGVRVTEVPVKALNSGKRSSVGIVRESIAFFFKSIELKLRLLRRN
jgi:hypothetical protein